MSQQLNIFLVIHNLIHAVQNMLQLHSKKIYILQYQKSFFLTSLVSISPENVKSNELKVNNMPTKWKNNMPIHSALIQGGIK